MMSFLKKLFARFLVSTRQGNGETLPHDPIASTESVGRFIYESNKYDVVKDVVKPGAFLPSRDPRETSVCRHLSNGEAEIWAIGDRIITGREAKARADFHAIAVEHAKLQLIPAPEESYPEHAVIIGWPEPKDEQKALAMELASRSKLRVK